MSVNKRKLLRQILNNPKNVKFNDFVGILSAYGFVCTRIEGSHNIFKNTTVKEIVNVQNIDGEVKPYQIRQFFSLVEKYNLKMEDE
jgi:predicted RNA binding protein YcfA (HicA-like mRNA interferase family)